MRIVQRERESDPVAFSYSLLATMNIYYGQLLISETEINT